ncbi:MAG: hypothetical protein V7647_2083 [Acidobacteriota bacterium]|jgi:4-amino-4-deoxy-L-arabinose transferase-like glycosyltransferase
MVLIIVVLSSSLVLARGLNSEYITLWDEAVHLNVVQNLITHCCTPRLHVRDLGTDYRDWTDNDVWLHKPPIPFFINAALAAPWPRSPLALRMPALLFAEALVVVVFLLGLRFFDRSSAALAAAAFAFNRYTFDLVQGRQFSGMPDLTLAFCLLGALYCLLAITESERQRHFVAFGVCSGAAFLCKDGLAFIPFIVLGAVVAKLGWRRHARGFVCAGVVAVLIAGTSAACLAWLFPVETRYEQQRRLAHLFENVEGWSRPADYYFTAYFTRVTSPLIAGLGYLCVGWGLLQWRRKPATAVLAMWVATYLVVLTPAVSKISDFIYPIAPVLYVLIAVALVQQWRSRGYDRIVAASTAVLAAALIIHFGLLGSHQWMVRAPSWRSRIAPPAIGVTIFGLSIAILRLSRIRITRGLAALSTGAAVLVALGTSVRANLAGPDLRPRDYDRQMALRQATLALPPDLRLRDDVVLVKWSGVKKSHLYVRFWAGLESLEITAANPLDRQMAVVRRVPDVYLLADAPDPQHEPALRVGPGYLYKIR